MEEVRFLVFGNSDVDRALASRITQLGGVAAVVPPPEDVADLRSLIEDYARAGPGLHIHPGTGHWKRRSELPSLADELGVTILGPSAHCTSLWNHTLNFLSALEELKIPNLLVGLYPFSSARELHKWIQEHQPELPLRIRSVSGRGSFASMLLRDETEFYTNISIFFEQLKLNISDPLVMIERYREGGRQIRLHFARLSTGEFQVFTLQDVSIQYKSRPWLEITPAQEVSDEARSILEHRARDIAAHTHFVGVGSLDFILDGNQSYVHQGIPGLTESFESVEAVCQTSLVDWQFAAAQMIPTPSVSTEEGCSLYYKVTYEDSLRGLVQQGPVWEFEPATGAQFSRQENLLVAGRVEGLSYAHALKQAKESIKNLWFSGELSTNESVLSELLSHPKVMRAIVHRDFFEEEFFANPEIDAHYIQGAADVCALYAESMSLTPVVRWISHRKKVSPKSSELIPGRAPVISPRGLQGSFKDLGRVTATCISRDMNSESLVFLVRIQNHFILVRGDTVISPISKLFAQLSGTIHSVFFREGAEVEPHRPVLLIESQKLLFGLSLPVKIKLLALRVRAGQKISIGEDLADLQVIK